MFEGSSEKNKFEISLHLNYRCCKLTLFFFWQTDALFLHIKLSVFKFLLFQDPDIVDTKDSLKRISLVEDNGYKAEG